MFAFWKTLRKKLRWTKRHSRRPWAEAFELEKRELLSGSVWAPIGPAPIIQKDGTPVSGRITGIAPDPSNADVIYVATAGGGVWKTTNATAGNGAAATWQPLTDGANVVWRGAVPVAFMGAIAMAPSNHSIIYAGTGEANNSADSFYGRGVLKSVDDGAHWNNMGGGYFNRKTISNIVVDPSDANRVYAAVSNGSNGQSGNTGIWLSSDGGETWTNTTAGSSGLTANDQFTDLQIDPFDPGILYAAVTGTAGGSANGVYIGTVSSSGGTTGVTWAPDGNFPMGSSNGRIALAVALQSNGTVYAAVEAAGTGQLLQLMKRDNSGPGGAGNWTALSGIPNYLTKFGWYGNELLVDEHNPTTVYAAGAGGGQDIIAIYNAGKPAQSIVDLSGSAPGSKNAIHPDHHALAFDHDGKLLDGDDGGIFRLNTDSEGVTSVALDSSTGVATVTLTALPGTYVAGDTVTINSVPVTGGVNFNGSFAITAVSGTSLSYQLSGATVNQTTVTGAADLVFWDDLNTNLQITQFTGIGLDPSDPNIVYGGSQDNGGARRPGPGTVWNELIGGDGGFTLVDPNNPQTVYYVPSTANSPAFQRSDDGGATPLVAKTSGLILNAKQQLANADFYPPYVMDPSNSQRLLLGADRIYETTDRGDNWTTRWGASPPTGWTSTAPIDALAIAKSAPNTIYAAAGGSAFVSFDDGQKWFNANLLGSSPLPAGGTVRQLLIDPTDDKIAYAIIANFTDDAYGHVYRTSNYGQVWVDISQGLVDAPVWSIALDARGGDHTSDVVYVGTDSGVFKLIDPVNNREWHPFGTALPNAQVADLKLDTSSLHVLAAGTHGRGVWEISVAPPVATAAADQYATKGLPKAIDLGKIAGGVGPYNVAVNWGDGTPDTTFTASSDGALGSQLHAYAAEAAYQPQVTVTDAANNSASTSFRVDVANASITYQPRDALLLPPLIVFGAETEPGMTAYFRASAVNTGSQPLVASWEFRNGPNGLWEGYTGPMKTNTDPSGETTTSISFQLTDGSQFGAQYRARFTDDGGLHYGYSDPATLHEAQIGGAYNVSYWIGGGEYGGPTTDGSPWNPVGEPNAWSQPYNWFPYGVPGSNTIAVFAANTPPWSRVYINDANGGFDYRNEHPTPGFKDSVVDIANIGGLYLAADWAGTLTITSSLHLSFGGEWDSGTINIGAAGELNNDVGGNLLLQGSLDLTGGGTLLNNGTIVETADSQGLNIDGSARLNDFEGIFEMQADVGLTGGGTFRSVRSLVEKTGGSGVSTIGVANFEDQEGVVSVVSGNLVLSSGTSGKSATVKYYAAKDTTLDLVGTGGVFYFGTNIGRGDGIFQMDQGGTIVAAADDATLDFNPGISVLNGGFQLASSVSSTLFGLVPDPPHTLTNIGEIRLTNPVAPVHLHSNIDRFNSLGGKLVNKGTILEKGLGGLEIDDAVTLDNQGTYEFTDDGTLGGLFVNTGTVRKTGPTGATSTSATSMINGPFNNLGGTVEASYGTIVIGGDGASTGGTFNAAAGAAIDLTAGNYTGTYTGSGTVEVARGGGIGIGSAGATFNFPDGLTLADGSINLGGNTLTNTGVLKTTNDVGKVARLFGQSGNATIGGTFDNNGTIHVQGLGGLQFDVTVNNNHVLLLDGDTDVRGGTFNNIGSGPGLGVVKTSGTGTSTVTVHFINQGGRVDAQTGTLVLDNDNLSLDGSTYNAEAGAVIDLAGRHGMPVKGTIKATGAGSVGLFQGGTIGVGDPTATLGGDGAFQIKNGHVNLVGSDQTASTLTIAGTLKLTNDAGTVDDFFGAYGNMTSIGGVVSIASTGRLEEVGLGGLSLGPNVSMNNSGVVAFSGNGSQPFNGDLTSSGSVILGASSKVSFNAHYTQRPTGTLEVQLGGAPAGGVFGQLNATGHGVTLDGTLQVDLVNGYQPAPGDAFTVVKYDDNAGTTFQHFTLPAGMSPQVGPHDVTLTQGTAGPSITSDASTTFTVGTAGTFRVTTSPATPLSEQGALPAGVTFTDNHDGTATLAGMPQAGSGGKYTLTITASNDVAADAVQTFTLTVNEAPSITSVDHASFTAGTGGSFTVTTGHDFPAAITLSAQGALPAGVSFTDNHDGTATLAVAASAAAGQTTLTITADNGVTPAATQAFTLNVGSVVAAATKIVLSSDHDSGAVYGQSVLVTATVSVPGAPSDTPTGSVQFQVFGFDFGGPVTLSGGSAQLTLQGFAVGSFDVTASYTSDDNLFEDSSTQAALTQDVAPAPLTITANDQTKLYGAALPSLSASFTGFVNGDTEAALTTPLTIATTATQTSGVGSIPITVGGAVAANYAITFVPGKLTVTPAPLTITADDQTKVFGAALPALTAHYAGFVNGDTEASLSTAPTVTTSATAASGVGSYDLTPGGAVAGNYTITNVAGHLTITPAPLTITAADQTIAAGSALPTLTATYSGFKNGDTAASLDTAALLATTATAASSPGVYPITVSAAADANYTITFVAGTLTISQGATQSATQIGLSSDHPAARYGDSIVVTAKVTATGGVPIGSVQFQVDGANVGPAVSLAAGSASTTLSGLGAGNHTITAVYTSAMPGFSNSTGTLAQSVAPAELRIIVDSQTIVAGQALPTFTFSFDGFVNGDSADDLDAQGTASTTATDPNVPGAYTINVDGAAGKNYTITVVPGTLTITAAAPPVIKAQAQTRGQTVTFTGIKLSGGTNVKVLSVTLSTKLGMFPLGKLPGVTVSGGGTGNVTLKGTPTAVKNAIKKISLHLNRPHARGNVTLTMKAGGKVVSKTTIKVG